MYYFFASLEPDEEYTQAVIGQKLGLSHGTVVRAIHVIRNQFPDLPMPITAKFGRRGGTTTATRRAQVTAWDTGMGQHISTRMITMTGVGTQADTARL